MFSLVNSDGILSIQAATDVRLLHGLLPHGSICELSKGHPIIYGNECQIFGKI